MIWNIILHSAAGLEHAAQETAQAVNILADTTDYFLVTLHPKVVHFPIALLVTGILFHGLFWLMKREWMKPAFVSLYALGFLGAGIAIITGLIASDTMGHAGEAHEFVHEHRNLMYIATGLWVGILLPTLYVFKTRKTKLLNYTLVAWVAVAGVLFAGAHEGGELVYKHGIGVADSAKSQGQPAQQDDHEKEGDHEH